MLVCPRCRGRLPIRSILGASTVVCPRCRAELVPTSWSVLIAIAVGSFANTAIADYLLPAGSRLARALLSGLIFAALTVPVYILTARFKLRPQPLSMFPRDDLRCLNCGAGMPAGVTTCPKCGWTRQP